MSTQKDPLQPNVMKAQPSHRISFAKDTNPPIITVLATLNSEKDSIFVSHTHCISKNSTATKVTI
jgi:hypothetical protein